jgi:hypothetical protein
MNSQFLLEKLESSREYEQFKKENPNAYLCSGFFIIDLETKGAENKYHFDFYIPSSKKTFSFEMEGGIKLVPLELREDEKVMGKIEMKDNFDFDNLQEMILKEMELKEIKNKIQKMLFSLQNKNGKDILIGTMFLSGLGLANMSIDIAENKITDFEKKSLFDMMKIIKK